MLAEAQRRDMLAAMGIDVYVLRTHTQATAPFATSVAAVDADLVVACAHTAAASVYAVRLRELLPHTLGIEPSRIRWIEADAVGAFAAPPSAHAYLLLGAPLLRTLGVHLSTTQQYTAVIAVADEPETSLRNGLAKRALWQALKPVARCLRAPAD